MSQLVVLLLFKFIIFCNVPPTLLTDALSCTNSKQEWMNLRYTTLVGPAASHTNLASTTNICPVSGGSSCCDSSMEQEMYTLGQRQLIEQSNSWLQVARQMKNDSSSLEYLFRTDLEQAKSRLHQFFSRIYGYNYKLHRSFFFGFFVDLEQYMAGQRGQLSQLIDNFFNQLRDSIVSLIERSGQLSTNSIFGNPNNAGGDNSNTGGFGTNPSGVGGGSVGALNEAAESRRIRCLSDRVAQVKPFDEVDVRLKARMMEAYPPARMLVNILAISSQLLFYLVEQVVAQSNCVTGVTRYRFCAICAGQSLSSVCPTSCTRLLSNCLQGAGPNEAQLTFIWPQLIDSIVLATNRLERSFNFPAVNRNLQMEISEAITNLQTRYTETKSKFESECRPVGRRTPTLFNPINPAGNQINPDLAQTSFSGWPNIQGMNRNRFSRSAKYYQSPVSQELLSWQTRPHQNSGNFYQNSPGYGQAFGSGNPRLGGTNGNNNNNNLDANVNLPESLIQHINQIKKTYTNLRNLFSTPAANLCPESLTDEESQKQNPQCWTPPDLPSVAPDVGITKILSQLDEASKRLHDTSVNIRDTDVMVIEPPVPRSHFDSTSNFDNSNNIQSTRFQSQILAQDQWQSPTTQNGFQNTYNAPNMPNKMKNVGLDKIPTSANKQNVFNANNAPFFASNVEGSGLERVQSPNVHMGNKYPSEQWPTAGTNPFNDNWRTAAPTTLAPDPPKVWESSGAPRLNGPILHELRPQITAAPTTTATTSSSGTTTVTYKEKVPATLQSSPFIETTTPITAVDEIPTTTSKADFTESANPDEVDNVLIVPTISEVMNRTANDTTPSLYTSTPTTPIPPTTATTTVQTLPPIQSHHRPEMSPNFGSIPDDEDELIESMGGQNQITQNPPPTQEMPPWSKNPAAGHQTTWQNPTVQGSGMAPDCRNFPNSPNCLQLPPTEGSGIINPLKQDSIAPNFYPPFNKPVESPTDSGSHKQTDWSGILSNQPPLSQPDISVPSHNEFTPQPNKQKPLGGPSQWQEMSGMAYPEIPQPPLQEQTRKEQFLPEPTRPPTPPRIDNIPPVLPHPPLPPPEVWVPAKLSHGQSVPPIFLIRKYNLEGPTYRQEKQSDRDSSSIPTPNALIITFLISTQLFLLYYRST